MKVFVSLSWALSFFSDWESSSWSTGVASLTGLFTGHNFNQIGLLNFAQLTLKQEIHFKLVFLLLLFFLLFKQLPFPSVQWKDKILTHKSGIWIYHRSTNNLHTYDWFITCNSTVTVLQEMLIAQISSTWAQTYVLLMLTIQSEIKIESRVLLWTIYLLLSFKGIKYPLAENTILALAYE